MDHLAEARSKIEAALTEVNEEATRLRTALGHLSGGSSGNGAGRGSGGRKRAPRRKRKLAPRGMRREEVLSAVRSRPGSTSAEIAKVLDISPAQVHGILKKLIAAKEVRKKGTKYTASPKSESKKKEDKKETVAA